MKRPEIGMTLICAETKKEFKAAREGYFFNFCISGEGEVLSNEGVYQRELQQLLNRDRPFYGYISSDGRHLVNFKGLQLGQVVSSRTVPLPGRTRRSSIHGGSYTHYTVRDNHGAYWYGRSSPGIAITLYPRKTPCI